MTVHACSQCSDRMLGYLRKAGGQQRESRPQGGQYRQSGFYEALERRHRKLLSIVDLYALSFAEGRRTPTISQQQ